MACAYRLPLPKIYADMNQVILEFSDQNDLMLLLSFAKRLDAKVVSIKKSRKSFAKEATDGRMRLMQIAAQDPLFLTDVREVMEDFAHADQDEL